MLKPIQPLIGPAQAAHEAFFKPYQLLASNEAFELQFSAHFIPFQYLALFSYFFFDTGF